MFSRFQASFLKGQSCEDQITRIIQVSKDGFQQRLMKRSLSTLLDFSKAYDTVWREKLLLHMLNTGVSPTFIHWIQYFLNDRKGLQPEVVTTIKKKGRTFTSSYEEEAACHEICTILDIHQRQPSFNLHTLLQRQ